MNSSHKITKTDKVELITSFFKSQNKRLTNISKVKVDKLDVIIKKYNIDVENLYCQKEVDKLIKEKEQRERDRDIKIETLSHDFNAKRKWNKLTDEMKEICYNALLEINKANEDKSLQTNIHLSKQFELEAILLKQTVERIDDVNVKINGIIVNCGYIPRVITKEENLKHMRAIKQQELTFTNENIIPLIDNFIIKIKAFKAFKALLLKKKKHNRQQIVELEIVDDFIEIIY